ncbi:uncharacterized protein SCHCODRAFT_02631455 [Schizophyllum commune H4-8]|uniref:uncharacterized protein n=1 Tax=Schizophyllum commune (strain H4-8 / FGSC 9210) TaxID=578458 RepID=UPI00215EB50A|nr:uncharacterized protein SCHCODRAFT_02631455 [Schizophyllum commune H4-8]KAI5890308.1 hypothetical protein SCHCODRAFT_02631455 [Schizophyllum commune H4-8]
MATSRPGSTAPGPFPPHPNQRGPGSTAATAGSHDLAGDDMSRAVNQAVAALNTVTSHFTARNATEPTLQSVSDNLDGLKGKYEREGQSRQTAIGGLKTQIYEDLPVRAQKELLPGLEDFMKELIAGQVKKTVDGSIGDYIAVPLAKQKEVAQAMAKKIDVELDNSRARLENSRLHPDDTDPFKAVLKKDGTESNVWPFDFRSLFAFEDKTLDKLLEDFDLCIGVKDDTKGVKFQDDIKRVKMQTFLAHIGAPIDVLHFV